MRGKYKRLFLSPWTSMIASIISILVLPAVYYFGSRSGQIDWADRYDLLLRLVLTATLYYSLKTHKLFLMQASTVGLIFCMLMGQAQYTLNDLAARDSETYIVMGIQGFIFLAVEMMILFIQTFICINHFVIHAVQRLESIRISINQISILFLLGFLAVQLIIAPTLNFGWRYILYIWTLHLNEFFIFILVACAELILMIDQREYAGG